MPLVAPADVPGRPADIRPFQYQYTTGQLAEKFSADQMERAAKELEVIASVNQKGSWKPTWESLDQHRAPEWFLDAKFGVMLNWGLHAVPAWDKKRGGAMYPDAYGVAMYVDPEVRQHHVQHWGADVQWDDFFPLFRAEAYDPEGWVRLLKDAGVRYLVPFSKHHDGIAWWDSQWTKRNTVQMGPRKDLLTPLMSAARRQGLKIGVYFCYEEWANTVLGENGEPLIRLWNWGQYAGTHPLTAENRRRISGNIPVRNYYDQYMTPLVKEMIDRFDPDCLWMDGEWVTPAETLRSRELAAYYYNRAAGRKEVYINDRYGQGTRDHHGDVYGSEYHSTASLTHPWEECRGISQSFAYNYEDTEESLGPATHVLHMLIDVVSRNGNLNLIIGPKPSGEIPAPVVRRLQQIGAWLKVNGEAIYASRILAPYKEGDVCFTRSKDGKVAYAICKAWPGKQLALKGIRALDKGRITMLGADGGLTWKQDDRGLVIDVPGSMQDAKGRPCEHAWTFRIPLSQ